MDETLTAPSDNNPFEVDQDPLEGPGALVAWESPPEPGAC
jgi:hypothetical protein